MREPVRIGVLGVQGAIEAHLTALERVGAVGSRVLWASELEVLDGLVIPGGESTTMSKGITRLGLWDPLRAFVELGRPVLGTCAGAILLARDVPHQSVPTLGVLDARASRNAYGTQVDSFAATADPDAAQGFADLPCVFIRAPKLGALGPEVEVLARVDGEPVLVRQHRVLASTFHPELSRDARVHQLLVDACGDEGRAV